MVASEARPFATSGGLSEVMAALPHALGKLGHRVTIILPKYRQVALGSGQTAEVETTLALGAAATHEVTYYRQPVSDRVAAVFVDVPELFDRDGLYGSAGGDYVDNGLRFALFSRAALEYLRLRGERASVIHAHDWQSGLVPAYQKMLFSSDPVVGGVGVVFTIHNLAFQGLFPTATIAQVGLPGEVLHVQAMEFWGQVSYLKAGINFSERITTVSPGYAREIMTPAFGCGFDGVLGRRAGDFSGILNGIDRSRWDPAADPYLPAPYTADDLAGKAAAKRALLEQAGLERSAKAFARPLIGMVSRLTDQKGFDLIAAAADRLMALDAAWVLLGSGEWRYEEMWRSLAARHPDRVATVIGYDERLEHLIQAGADALLMPSRFEPCGLNQLNSQRYGTLPIVRATGGLDDTVVDAGPAGRRSTGFKFVEYTADGLVGAVVRALAAFATPKRWHRMQANAMRQDYSWDISAREYVKVYSALS